MKINPSLLNRIRNRLDGRGYTKEEHQSASERVAPGISVRKYIDMMLFYGCAIRGEVKRGNTLVEGVYIPRNN